MRSTRRGSKRDNKEKVAALQKSLKEAEQKVEQAQKSRDEIAAQLKALGQVVITRPWTHEHLEDAWESRCVDFREEYGECEDFEGETDDDAKRWAIRLLKMHDAIEGHFPSDGKGYIDEDGSWVDFEASEKDLEEFEWDDADVLW